MRTCTKCGTKKEISEFGRHSSSNDGIRKMCKECVREYSKKYRDKNPDKIKENFLRYLIKNPENYKKSRKKYRLNHSNDIKRRRELDSDKNKEYQKEYRKKHKKENSAWQAGYRSRNREKINENLKRYLKERKSCDPVFKLKGLIRNSFYRTLDNKNIFKEKSSFDYTGISKVEYIEHLKNDPLWLDYSDDNSAIHIDHIIPIALYDFSDSEEIMKCWDPRNLRLLPAFENMSKQDKFLPELVKQYKIEDLLPKGLNMS